MGYGEKGREKSSGPFEQHVEDGDDNYVDAALTLGLGSGLDSILSPPPLIIVVSILTGSDTMSRREDRSGYDLVAFLLRPPPLFVVPPLKGGLSQSYNLTLTKTHSSSPINISASVRRQISWDKRLTHSTTATGGTDNEDEE